MRIITNEKLIRRNSRLGQYASLGGLAILAGGFFISLRFPQYTLIAWLALLLGFILSQVGLYYANRWGRSPRPDQHLDEALKGLDDRNVLYHYTSPTHHLLVGPLGVWLLLPYHQAGTIVYEKNHWKQKGGSLLQKYLRLFAQEGMGRPDLEATAEIEALQKYLKKRMPDTDLPPINTIMVFTSEKAVIETEDTPIPAVYAKKLKDWIRKMGKEKSLAPEKAMSIQDAIEHS